MLRMLLLCVLGGLALSGCTPPVFYTDAVVALAAPEVLAAWDNSGSLWPPARVDAGNGRADFVSRDLEDRKSLPPAVLLGFSVSENQLTDWKKRFPTIRWATVVPGASSTNLVNFSVSLPAGWTLLIQRAGAGKGSSVRAVAIVPESTSAEVVAGLGAAWKAVTGAELLVSKSSQPLQTPWDDVFQLDPLAVADVSASPKARIHTGFGVSATGVAGGFGLRLDGRAAQVLRDGLGASAGTNVELPWEVFARKGQESS